MEKEQKTVTRFMIGVAIGVAMAGIFLMFTTGKIIAVVPAVVALMFIAMLMSKKRDDSN